MRVDFYVYSSVEKKAHAKRFFKCLNWPIAFPEKGWKVTFLLRSTDSNEISGQLKMGKVMHNEQPDQTHAKAWVDMGEFAERLQNQTMEVICWKAISTSSSTE